MFLLDDRFLTVVAFVQGCDSATGERLLQGFNDWVANRIGSGESSLYWSSQIANKHGVESETDIPLESRAVVIEDLFKLLDEFLSERPTIPEIVIE